jgi:hypothetical protein
VIDGGEAEKVFILDLFENISESIPSFGNTLSFNDFCISSS